MPRSKADNNKLIELGSRIKTLREKKGMTQEALALTMYRDKQSVQRLEAGKVNPGYLYLRQISEGLEIDITTLLKDLSS